MKLNFVGDVSDIEQGLKMLEKRLGFSYDGTGTTVRVKCRAGNIEIKADGGEILVEYQEKIHFFRALGLLVEKIKKGEREFYINETPHFKTNGIMYDSSSSAVLTTDSIKKTIEIMALMGLDTLMLYSVDVYEIKELPYFGYMRGRYTYEELKECDNYAALFGAEMMPCIQTLGHLRKTLKWEHVPGIKDTHETLFVGEEATYEFIEKMIVAASAPFRSKRIHIGMDEAYDMGLGNYLTKNGYRRRFDIFNEHLARVKEITDKHGLEPMIWSDMYFKLGSKTADFYVNSVIPRDVIDSAPSGIQLVYWDYYRHDAESYRSIIRKHKEFNNETVFAGGIWIGNSPAFDHEKTLITSNAALTACKEEGVRNVFACIWAGNGDSEAGTNFFSSLPGMQLYAEHGYSETVDDERLKERLKTCAGQDIDAYICLGELDRREFEYELRSPTNPSRVLLWQDILIGLFDKNVEGMSFQKYYEELAEKLKSHRENAGEFAFVFDVPIKIANVLSIKAEMGVRLKAAYDAGDKALLTQISDRELPDLYMRVQELRVAQRQQWLTTNKAFGWEIHDMRYGGLLARIDTAIFRINEYINGEIDQIPELAEERLYFDKEEKNKIPICRHFERIVSVF